MPTDPPRLLGSYAVPAVRMGQLIDCAIRGEVEVVGMSAGPISWPIGRIPPRGRQRFLILTGDLVEAVRRESVAAVCHWWGVRAQTVWRWRKALGVGAITEGTSRLKGEAFAPHMKRDGVRRVSHDRPREEELDPLCSTGEWRSEGDLNEQGSLP